MNKEIMRNHLYKQLASSTKTEGWNSAIEKCEMLIRNKEEKVKQQNEKN